MKSRTQAVLKYSMRRYRYIVNYAAFVLAVYLFEWLVWWRVYKLFGAYPDNWSGPFTHNAALAMGLLLWAIWKGSSSNPVSSSNFREWLRTTPWTSEKRLPFNSVTLTWQDVLILSASLLVWTAPVHRFYLLLAFFVPYCLGLTANNFATKQFTSVYAAIATASIAPLVIRNPWWTLAVMLSTYACCHWGFRRSLDHFPWDESVDRKLLDQDSSLVYDAWPMVNRGRLRNTDLLVPWKHTIALSMLISWIAAEALYFLLMSLTEREKIGSDVSTWAGLAFASFAISLVRLFVYTGNRKLPLGPFARIAIGRIVIPDYDRVFLAPLAILLVGCLLPRLLLDTGLTEPSVAFVTLLPMLLMAMGMGPTMAEWNFVGEYRVSYRTPREDVRRVKTT